MTQFLKNFARDEEGASLVEYSVLIGLVTAAVIVTISSVGGRVTKAWTTLDGSMDTGGMTK
jgi:pilus assembly protein Flp/PilA